MDEPVQNDVSLRDFQRLIHKMYFRKGCCSGSRRDISMADGRIGRARYGPAERDDMENLHEEFADVIAWLTTIANVAGVDLCAALEKKYGRGCPGCHRFECECPLSEKP